MGRSSEMGAAMSFDWRFWGAWGTPLVIVLVITFCTGIDFGSTPRSLDSDSAFAYERREVPPAFKRIAGPEATEPFGSIVGLALAHDQQSFYVLDASARRIHRLNLDGMVQASMGGEGRGPGELAGPVAIRAVAEGVWVLDADNMRATLFGADGTMLRAVSLEAPAFSFAPVGGEAVVVPATTSTTGDRADGQESPPILFLVDGQGSQGVVPEAGVQLPDLLASSGPRERLMWVLARLPDDALVIVDRSSLAAWRVSLSPDARRIAGVASLAVPEGIRAWVQGIEPPEPDMRLMAVSGVRVISGQLWLMTTGLGRDLLGFTSPLAGNAVQLVLPGALGDQELIDAIVLPDRVIAATLTEVVLAAPG